MYIAIMKIETHAKIGIWVGIISLIIAMSFFTLHESQSLKYEYGRLFVDENEMYEKLTTTGTMSAFKEKYPYFYEDFNIRRDGSGNLEVFAFNNQTGNRLELNIRYDQDDDRLRENVHCQFSRGFEQYSFRSGESFALDSDGSYPAPLIMLMEGNARGQFVEDFIKYTNCLEDPPIPEPTLELEPPDPVPECRGNTTLVDGVCMITIEDFYTD